MTRLKIPFISFATTSCTYEAYRSTSFFSSLDGLRCFSILVVIGFHTQLKIGGLSPLLYGDLGVDLFFAISGFLITTLLLREQEKWGRISLRAFYVRRGLRIFPLYYTVLAIYIILTWLLERSSFVGLQFFSHLPYYITYTSNWFVNLDKRVIFYFAWSLATEEQFYLIWPSVEKFMKGWKPVFFVAVLLIIREIVEKAVLSGRLQDYHLGTVILLSIHPAILGGVIMAHALHDQRTFTMLSPLLGARWMSLFILAGLVAAVEMQVPIGYIWTLMVLLVGSVVIRESNGLSPILKWRPIAHIGMTSYGIYLLHMLCYHASLQVLQIFGMNYSWLSFLVTVLLAILVATISYRYYESWFLRLKNKFARVQTRHPVDEEPKLS